MKNIEIEYKVMIDEKAYDLLISKYKTNTYSQINYYYDTNDRMLFKNGYSLRIRYINNKYLLTLKEKIKDGHVEYEEYLDSNDILLIPTSIKNKINFIKLDDLLQLGKMETLRSDASFENHIVSIDKNMYLDSIDYELECEAESLAIGKEIIDRFIKNTNIKYKISDKSKQKRALGL